MGTTIKYVCSKGEEGSQCKSAHLMTSFYCLKAHKGERVSENQCCFANVETTSINVCRLNFHFQPNINVETTLMNVDDQCCFKVDSTLMCLLGMYVQFTSCVYWVSLQKSIVFLSGILVNKKSTSRLAIYKLGSCLQISSEKYESLMMVYLFSVKDVENGSSNYASLYNRGNNIIKQCNILVWV